MPKILRFKLAGIHREAVMRAAAHLGLHVRRRRYNVFVVTVPDDGEASYEFGKQTVVEFHGLRFRRNWTSMERP